ncbi:MAG: hypothetical protein HC866_10620 [Leptolyngbyaceae cyanobacterium RU_5_1]|nr:hypothetical protein [Leptolyngbyaceae cyanobacterium RU_5_1]
MKTNTDSNWMFYNELEQIPGSVLNANQYNSTLTSWLQRLWKPLINALNWKRMPEVWCVPDQAGNVWWHIYDPLTGETQYLLLDDEVQSWLKHYRKT